MNLRSAPGLKYYFWIGVSLTLIFAFLEPAGTRGAGIFGSVVIWALQIGFLLPLLILLHILLQKSNAFNDLNPWLKLTASGAIGSVLFVPFAIGIDYLFALDDWSAVNDSNALIAVIIDEFTGVFFPVTLVWVAINAPRVLRLSFVDKKAVSSGPPHKSNENGTPASLPQFLPLIPRDMGDDLIYIKSELHYVRVVTTDSENLILYNLKDAISDVEKIVDGIQTHRSYWVSAGHIMELIKDKGRKYILLSNGQKVPVSRRKSPEIQQYINHRQSRHFDKH